MYQKKNFHFKIYIYRFKKTIKDQLIEHDMPLATSIFDGDKLVIEEAVKFYALSQIFFRMGKFTESEEMIVRSL